jgi:glyoxylase-like metal-dependent hydrolase (beta-lactamase superfamily II)
MKIGGYEIIPIETGRFALDGGAMFGVVPKVLWAKKNPPDDKNRIELALRCLLLKSSERIILIDTGIGLNWDDKFKTIYNVDNSEYSLIESLNQHNIKPDEISDVILTHLHFDHAGGISSYKNEEFKLTFPNARHHIQGEQWEWAMNPAEKDRASFISERFTIIKQKEKLNLLDAAGPLFKNIELMVMYGHTQGMQLVKVSDSHNTLLYCADLIPTATHIPVPWIMGYDNNPLTTISEKNRILPLAAENNWILFFEHDPTQAAARIKRTDKGFTMDEEVALT